MGCSVGSYFGGVKWGEDVGIKVGSNCGKQLLGCKIGTIVRASQAIKMFKWEVIVGYIVGVNSKEKLWGAKVSLHGVHCTCIV